MHTYSWMTTEEFIKCFVPETEREQALFDRLTEEFDNGEAALSDDLSMSDTLLAVKLKAVLRGD